MTDQPTKKRRRRRTKAEIAAEKAAKEAAALEAQKMEAEGYERVRARDAGGHFIPDDPSTPENEAWEWQKKGDDEVEIEVNFGSSYEKEIDEIIEKEEECIPCQKEAAAALEAAEAAIEEEVAKEEPVVTAPPSEPKKDPYADYVPMYGSAKKRNRLAQRQKIQRIQDLSKAKHNE